MHDDSHWAQHPPPLAAPPARRSPLPYLLAALALGGVAAMVAVVYVGAPSTHRAEVTTHRIGSDVAPVTVPLATATPEPDRPTHRVRPETVERWTTVFVQAECDRNRRWRAHALLRNDAEKTRTATVTYDVRAGSEPLGSVRGSAIGVAPHRTAWIDLSGVGCNSAIPTAYDFAVEETT